MTVKSIIWLRINAVNRSMNNSLRLNSNLFDWVALSQIFLQLIWLFFVLLNVHEALRLSVEDFFMLLLVIWYSAAVTIRSHSIAKLIWRGFRPPIQLIQRRLQPWTLINTGGGPQSRFRSFILRMFAPVPRFPLLGEDVGEATGGGGRLFLRLLSLLLSLLFRLIFLLLDTVLLMSLNILVRRILVRKRGIRHLVEHLRVVIGYRHLEVLIGITNVELIPVGGLVVRLELSFSLLFWLLLIFMVRH